MRGSGTMGSRGSSARVEESEEDKTKPLVQRVYKRAKETATVMAGTPRVLGMVWNANKRYCAALVALNVLLGLAPLAEMWITKQLVDTVVASVGKITPTTETFQLVMQVVPNVIPLLLMFALVQLLAGCIEPTVRLVHQTLSDILTCDINTRIMRKANSLVDISVFETPKFYDALQRAQNEAGHRPMMMLLQTASLIRNGIGLCSMAGVLIFFQPLLAFIVLLLSLPHLVVQFKHQRETWSIQSQKVPEVRRMQYFSKVLTNNTDAKEVRIFGLGDFFLNSYLKTWKEFHESHTKLRRTHWRRNAALATLAALGSAGAFAYIALRTLSGSITLGSFTMYATAVKQLEDYLQSIIWSMATLYEGNLFVNHLFEFMDIQPGITSLSATESHNIPNTMTTVEFKNVGFSYPDADKPVLQDLSFEIKPGETVALVGENGAGKTTLVKLLARLYDPTAGAIFVDGKNLNLFDLDQWRASISVVFQDYGRYHMNARENIGLGDVRRMDDLDAVRSAAERSGAQPIIDKLSGGYETTLGRWFQSDNGGSELSGGEWQKIALARAFMRTSSPGDLPPSDTDFNGTVDGDGDNNHCAAEPPGAPLSNRLIRAAGPVEGEGEPSSNAERGAQLLILDEPTSALDAQSEYDVYLRFHELTRGKSTLLISHRFSTVKMADKIIVLEHGGIIEQGSHDDLMALGGTYARLYKLQADRYRD